MSLTNIFSEHSTRIAHAAAQHFQLEKITLVCDVGRIVFICYDAVEKTFFNRHDVERVRFGNIIALLQHFECSYDSPIIDITTIRGIKLRYIEEYGDANTVLHSCFSALYSRCDYSAPRRQPSSLSHRFFFRRPFDDRHRAARCVRSAVREADRRDAAHRSRAPPTDSLLNCCILCCAQMQQSRLTPRHVAEGFKFLIFPPRRFPTSKAASYGASSRYSSVRPIFDVLVL